MDPNANLEEQEELLAQIAHGLKVLEKNPDKDARAFVREELKHDRARLGELRDEMGAWLFRGGFHPDWTKYPEASKSYGTPDMLRQLSAQQQQKARAQ